MLADALIEPSRCHHPLRWLVVPLDQRDIDQFFILFRRRYGQHVLKVSPTHVEVINDGHAIGLDSLPLLSICLPLVQ